MIDQDIINGDPAFRERAAEIMRLESATEKTPEMLASFTLPLSFPR
ncbi:MAG: hypothetical protein AAFU85_23955 [Planctomycetota bacterium]